MDRDWHNSTMEMCCSDRSGVRALAPGECAGLCPVAGLWREKGPSYSMDLKTWSSASWISILLGVCLCILDPVAQHRTSLSLPALWSSAAWGTSPIACPGPEWGDGQLCSLGLEEWHLVLLGVSSCGSSQQER